MNPLHGDAHPLPIARGSGDFQHKDAYAKAEVEIHEGRISAVEFTDESGDQIPGAGALRRLLAGKTVPRALEVNAEVVEETGAAVLTPILSMVLIEAFHRAVESCFDEE